MLYFPVVDVGAAGQEMVREKLEEVVTREPISGKCEQSIDPYRSQGFQGSLMMIFA